MTHFSEEAATISGRRRPRRGRAWRALAAQPTRPAGRHRRLRPRRAVSRKDCAIGARAERLDGCFARIARVEKQIEELKRQFESEVRVQWRWDRQKWKSCLRQVHHRD